MRKIANLLIVFLLSGCYGIGFDKGTYPSKSLEFERDTINQNAVLKKKNSVYIEFSSHQCGGYGLFGILVPLIPYWNNSCSDHEDFDVSIRKASAVYIKHNDKIYYHSRYNPKSYFNYTFPIPVKSLSDGAILVIEKKNESSKEIEKFEIPFRYQHTFSFVLWGT